MNSVRIHNPKTRLVEGSFSEVAYFIYVMARLLRGAGAGLLGGIGPLLLALASKLV